MRKQRLLKMIPVLVVIASLTIATTVGCSSGNSDSATRGTTEQKPETAPTVLTPKKGGTLTIAVQEEPDTLDIHKTGMAIGETITANMGGGLVTQDPNTMEIKPYLAESWITSEDGKTWTFKIRSGVKFHDGTPLTAKSFEYTFKRILDPKTAAGVAGSLLSALDSVEALDDTTLVLKLKAPYAPLLQFLSSPGMMQSLSKEAVEKAGKDYGHHPVGVGPWKFESWQNGNSIIMVRNEDFNWAESIYNNQGSAYPDKLIYKFIPENQTMLAALESGSIDIATNVEAKDIKKYQNNPKYEVKDMTETGLSLFVMMNTDKFALKDVNIRQAITKAINKEAIIQSNLMGQGVPAYGPLPPTFFGYDENVKQYGLKFLSYRGKGRNRESWVYAKQLWYL